MGDVSWNYFRYAADYLHFGGMAGGLASVYLLRSVDGLSWKTQVLYQLVFISRYLDLFTQEQVAYLVFFKITFNLITAGMLIAFVLFRDTYDAKGDSCNLVAILMPTAIAAYLFSREPTFVETMWTLSEYLETFALVPQYILCYKTELVGPRTALYVLAVGGYRVLYVCNWIYKRSKWHSSYTDYTSWASGGIECLLWADFAFRLFRRQVCFCGGGREPGTTVSFMGMFVLKVDGGVGKISEVLEMRTVGRRLPYGLSGNSDKEVDCPKKEWDTRDRLVEEEGCKLLTLSDDNDTL